MTPSSKYKKIAILLAIIVLPGVFYLLLYSAEHNYTKLSFIGPKEAVEKPDGTYDTLYHTIPYFEFVNQDNKKVTRDDLLGSIYIADFFFVTCPTICPKMTTNMGYIQSKFADKKDLNFISITVNPEHDSVEVLKEYADKVHADTESWSFLTGDKEEIYDLAFKGFFVNADKDDIAPGGFLHSQMLILVDRNGHIRGYFDGTVYSEMKKDLTDAIDILYKEDVVPLKGKKLDKIEQRK
jgi:protein SCO1/2